MEQQVTRLQLVARFAATFVAVSGLLVLVGWMLGNPVLKSFYPGFVPMNPATAVMFLLCAACLVLSSMASQQRKVAVVILSLGGLVFIGGLLTFLGHFLSWRLGFDRALFSAALGANEMALNTAFYFACFGFAVVLAQYRSSGRWLSQALVLTVLGGAVVSVLGYGYGSPQLYGIGDNYPMALNTSIVFVAATVGLLCVYGDNGIFSIFMGSYLGSSMARTLIPIAVIAPCIIGLLRIVGQRAGFYNAECGVALMVVVTVALLVTAIIFTARALNRADLERYEASEALRLMHLELRSQTQVLRSVVESMGEGVVVANQHGEFALFNPAAERILGMGAHKIEPEYWSIKYGYYLADGVTPYPPQQLPLLRTMRGESFDEEEVFIRNQGHAAGAWISITGRPLREVDGGISGGVVVLRDVSERKRAEDLLRNSHLELERRVALRTRELAESNRELLQQNQENELFVYSVSHDLRSPLVNLQGFSRELAMTANDVRQLLVDSELPSDYQENVLGLIDRDMHESIRFIQTAVTRLSGIIDALLRLSRAGRVEYQMRIVDTNSNVALVVESMSGSAFESGANITIADLPPVYGDPNAVEQVFANLIGNALKYRDSSRPCEIEIGFDPTEKDVPANCNGAYFVRDNGLGIAEEFQAKVFQAFKRLHPHVASGDGMGLAIVRRMVERQGGKVWIKSVAGSGSTFFVALPSPVAEPSLGELQKPCTKRIQENGESTTYHIAR
jgi:PAS domain S-box-containing protein